MTLLFQRAACALKSADDRVKGRLGMDDDARAEQVADFAGRALRELLIEPLAAFLKADAFEFRPVDRVNKVKEVLPYAIFRR